MNIHIPIKVGIIELTMLIIIGIIETNMMKQKEKKYRKLWG